MIKRVPLRPLDRRSEAGLTLVELLVAMLIAGLVMAVVPPAFRTVIDTTDDTERMLTSSGGAMKTSAWFADDVADSRDLDSEAGIRREVPGCKGSHALVRLLNPGSAGVTVHSYAVGDDDGTPILVRSTCGGADLAAALDGPILRQTVVDDLADEDSVEVTCSATTGSEPEPVTEEGDRRCRLVTIDVETATGYEFRLEGRQTPIRTPSNSPPTVKSCTLLSSADTWISSYDPDTNYGREWHMSTFRRKTGAYGYVTSLPKIDLLGPCTGAGEPAALPGGVRLTSADLQLWHIRNGSPDNAAYESEHAIRVLGSPWDEHTVTWHTRPGAQANTNGLQAGSNTVYFEPGRPFSGMKALRFPVLNEVSQWYRGAAGGGWANNGWQIDRGDGTAPDDTGGDNGFWWGSRESSDARWWPRLIVTWR